MKAEELRAARRRYRIPGSDRVVTVRFEAVVTVEPSGALYTSAELAMQDGVMERVKRWIAGGADLPPSDEGL